MRIFCIDDDALIRRALERSLRATGADLRLFDNPLEALRVAQVDPPDLLISDYSLPDLDGIDALTAIRKAHPQVRTVLLSGSVPDGKVAEAIEGGVVDRVLGKPWGNAELRAAISDLSPTDH